MTPSIPCRPASTDSRCWFARTRRFQANLLDLLEALPADRCGPWPGVRLGGRRQGFRRRCALREATPGMVHLRFVLPEADRECRASHAEGWPLMGTSERLWGCRRRARRSFRVGCKVTATAELARVIATERNPRLLMERRPRFLPRQHLGRPRRQGRRIASLPPETISRVSQVRAGSDRRSLGRAVSQYVSKSAGGSRQAAQRMGSSRGAGAGLVRFHQRRQREWRA